MSGKSFVSIYTGAPQLDQLNDDMRAAELLKEAPRVSVPEIEFNAMRSGIMRNGVHDKREMPLAPQSKEAAPTNALSSFQTGSGELIFLTPQSTLCRYLTDRW